MVRKRGAKHMRFKGEIGQSVLIKATIDEIIIQKSGVIYGVMFEGKNEIPLHFKEQDVFELDEAQDLPVEAPADEKKIKKKIDEAMDGADNSGFKSNYSHRGTNVPPQPNVPPMPKPKKRGRPRKATIESIMEKAEKEKGEAKR